MVYARQGGFLAVAVAVSLWHGGLGATLGDLGDDESNVIAVNATQLSKKSTQGSTDPSIKPFFAEGAESDGGEWGHDSVGAPILWGPTDSLPRIESLQWNSTTKIPPMGTAMMVCGGMTSLWMLGMLEEPPRQLVLFDLAKPQVLYMQLILRLLLMSNTRMTFLNRLFGRNFRGKEYALTPNATLLSLIDQVVIDEDVIAQTKSLLTNETSHLYKEYLEENVIRVPDGKKRRLYPAWPLTEWGDMETLVKLGNQTGNMGHPHVEEDHNMSREDRVGSVFYNQAGFMKTDETYQTLLGRLRAIPDIILLELDLPASDASDFKKYGITLDEGVLLFVSNVHLFSKGGREKLETKFQGLLPAANSTWEGVGTDRPPQTVCMYMSTDGASVMDLSEISTEDVQRFKVGAPNGSLKCGGSGTLVPESAKWDAHASRQTQSGHKTKWYLP